MAASAESVGAGWLEPLLSDPGRTEVVLHIEPIPNQVAADRLRKQLARLESSARSDAERRRLRSVTGGGAQAQVGVDRVF